MCSRILLVTTAQVLRKKRWLVIAWSTLLKKIGGA